MKMTSKNKVLLLAAVVGISGIFLGGDLSSKLFLSGAILGITGIFIES